MKTSDPMQEKIIISVVAPVYKEAKGLMDFYERVATMLDKLGEPWELVMVNDGSPDNSFEVMLQIHQRDPRVKLVNFARNFGHQTAVTAGMAHTSGDAVVLIDSDLQDPPETIPAMVAKWREGYQVVYAVRNKRPDETWFKLLTAKVFYRLLYRITDVDIPVDTGDFRLMDRKVVNAVNAMPEHNRFIRGMTSWVGFRQTGVSYDRAPRKWGETNYPLRKMLKLAWDGITGFSYFPLQLAMYMSLILFALSILGIPLVIFLRLQGHAELTGQATAVIVMLLIGSAQFLFFFIMGQYLARIYDEVRSRPLYVVADTVGFSDQAGPQQQQPTEDQEHLGNPVAIGQG